MKEYQHDHTNYHRLAGGCLFPPEDEAHRICRGVRFAAAVKWDELGMISQSKASKLAGVSRQEFLVALNRFQVSPFQVTPEELAREAADT